MLLDFITQAQFFKFYINFNECVVELFIVKDYEKLLQLVGFNGIRHTHPVNVSYKQQQYTKIVIYSLYMDDLIEFQTFCVHGQEMRWQKMKTNKEYLPRLKTPLNLENIQMSIQESNILCISQVKVAYLVSCKLDHKLNKNKK